MLVFVFGQIDFPEVTKRKHAIIQSNSVLSSLLNLDGQKKKVVPPIGRRLPLLLQFKEGQGSL